MTGTLQDARPHLSAWWDELLGCTAQQSPDFWEGTFEKFLVNDSRNLSQRASGRPLGGARIFAVDMGEATVYAQNALLKLLEEPIQDIYFFLAHARESLILRTLASRCVYLGRVGRAPQANVGKAFLHNSYPERLKKIERFDAARALDLLDDIECALHAITPRARREADMADEIFRTREILYNPGVSVKLIFGHFAVMLPVV